MALKTNVASPRKNDSEDKGSVSSGIALSFGNTSNDASKEEALLAYSIAMRFSEEIHRNKELCDVFKKQAAIVHHNVDQMPTLRNYVAHMSSCSEDARVSWFRHLVDTFASPDMVQLRVPNSGRAGAMEDAANMRSYFFRALGKARQYTH